MGKLWKVSAVLIGVAVLASCGTEAPSADPAEDSVVEVPSETAAVGPDLSDEAVLQELCGFSDEVLALDTYSVAAYAEAPEFWLAAGVPAVNTQDALYCEETSGVTFMSVRLEGAAENLPVAEEWIAGVEAAGYAPQGAPGYQIDTIRQLARGEMTGTGSFQWFKEGQTYGVGVRAFNDKALQLWVQNIP